MDLLGTLMKENYLQREEGVGMTFPVFPRQEQSQPLRGVLEESKVCGSEAPHPWHGQELLESKTCLQNLLDLSSDWVWEVDAAGRYTFVSDRVQDFLGYTPAELIGKTPFDIMPPEEAERVAPVLRAIATAQRSFRGLESVCIAKDGKSIYLETSGVPIFDAEGTYCGYQGIARDITEQKRGEAERKAAEAALRYSEARLAALMRNLPGMAYICKNDPNWTMTFISEGVFLLVKVYSPSLAFILKSSCTAKH